MRKFIERTKVKEAKMHSAEPKNKKSGHKQTPYKKLLRKQQHQQRILSEGTQTVEKEDQTEGGENEMPAGLKNRSKVQ